MGFVDRALGILGYERREANTMPAQIVEPTEKASLSTGASSFTSAMSGGTFNQNFSSFNNGKQQLASYVDWTYTAVRAISEHCSEIDLRIFLNRTKQKNLLLSQRLISHPKDMLKLQQKMISAFDWNTKGEVFYQKSVPALQELETSPLLDILMTPNPFMTKNEFFEVTFIDLELTGNAYWCIRRGKGGKPAELWPLMPNLMTVVPDPDEYIAGYLYLVNGQQVTFAPNDIIHHKYTSPVDMRVGYSPVQAIARTIDTDAHAAEFNRKMFYNYAMPDGLLTTDANVDVKVLKRLKDEWMDTYGGTSNAHRVAVLTSGMKFTELTGKQKDMEFQKGRDFARDQILANFGVPKSIIGLDESMSRANADSAEYVFTKRNRTKLQRVCNTITKDLAPQFDPRLITSFTDPVPEDKEFLLKETGVALGGGAQTGYATINEQRAKRGDPPIDGGDVIYIPGSLVPIGKPEADPKEQEVSADIQENHEKPNLDDSDESDSDDGDDSGDDSGGTDTGADNASPGDASGSTTSPSTNDSGSVASFTNVVTKGPIPIQEGCTRCECCSGYGEHDTGFECYRCDASGSVTEQEAKEAIPCAGREDSTEVWVDEDGHYRHAEERKSVKAKVPAFPSPIVENAPKGTDELPAFPPSIPEAEVMSEGTAEVDTADEDPQTGDKPVTGWTSDMLKFMTKRARQGQIFENQTLRGARDRFLEQKAEVLWNIKKRFTGEKALKRKEAKKQLDGLFDQTANNAAWVTLLTPIYNATGAVTGALAMDLVNDPVRYGYDVPTPAVAVTYDNTTDAIKQYFDERAGTVSKGIDAETDKQLRATLTEGVRGGEGLAELVDRVERVYGAAAGYRAQRIARTEAQTALHFASAQAWEQSGMVKTYRWITGSNPCVEVCEGLAGTTAKSPDGFRFGGSPAHPSCYDSQTEVLTDKGWKLFKDIVGDEQIKSIDLPTEEIEYVDIKANVKQVVENVIHYTSKTVDVVISEDHNNVVWNKDDRKLVSQRDMPLELYANPLATDPNVQVFALDAGEKLKRIVETGSFEVYDLELEKNHTLFVRRNGKVLLSGNCRCDVIPDELKTVSEVMAESNE